MTLVLILIAIEAPYCRFRGWYRLGLGSLYEVLEASAVKWSV